MKEATQEDQDDGKKTQEETMVEQSAPSVGTVEGMEGEERLSEDNHVDDSDEHVADNKVEVSEETMEAEDSDGKEIDKETTTSGKNVEVKEGDSVDGGSKEIDGDGSSRSEEKSDEKGMSEL